MHGRFSIAFLLLVVITGMVQGGCASRDTRHTTRLKDDYQKRLDKARVAVTDEVPKSLPEMTAEEHERVGDQYFQQNDLPMAFVHYDKALRMASTKTNLQYKQGLVFLKRGLAQEALRAFQDVVKTDDTFALAHEGMGQAFLLLGDVRAAEKRFQHAVALDANLWKSHNFLGMLHDHQERFDAAMAFYKSAIAFEKNNGLLWNNLGVSYYRKGDYDNAMRTFEKALRMNYTEAKVYNNLGLALAKLGRYQEALIVFTHAGDAAKAHNNLGVIHLAEGRYEEARAAFTEAMTLSPRYYPTASDNLRLAQQALRALPATADILSILSGKRGVQPPR